jgi:hypothetical protein
MAGDDVFAVRPDELIRHAGATDAVADAVELAARAGESVLLGAKAYGQLCQLVPALIDPIQRDTVGALRDSAVALRSAGDGVRAVARSYVATDQRSADSFVTG